MPPDRLVPTATGSSTKPPHTADLIRPIRVFGISGKIAMKHVQAAHPGAPRYRNSIDHSNGSGKTSALTSHADPRTLKISS